MLILRYILPFTYMIHSRIRAPREQAILLLNEIAPNLLILYFLKSQSMIAVSRMYFLAYAAFVSIYEIGYFANDFLAVRKETDPRVRIPGLNPSWKALALWIGVRIAVFAWVSSLLGFLTRPSWVVFYVGLAVYLFLHNWLTSRYVKSLTYMGLATMRIISPTFMFLSREQIVLVLPTLLVCHVFFRTVSYMDAKRVLDLTGRNSNPSRVAYYALMIVPNVIFSMLMGSGVPLLLSTYYLVEVSGFCLAAQWFGNTGKDSRTSPGQFV